MLNSWISYMVELNPVFIPYEISNADLCCEKMNEQGRSRRSNANFLFIVDIMNLFENYRYYVFESAFWFI